MNLILVISVFIFEVFIVADGKRSGTEELIFGGKPADIRDFPYQVAMLEEEYQMCGGSIISKNYILTAAHCVYGPRKRMSIIYGTHNINHGGDRVGVRQFYMHDHYDDRTFENDIAVLELAQPIRFSRSAKPIQLSVRPPRVGDKAFVSGWGKTESGKSSISLLKTVVDIVDLKTCSQAYGRGKITPNMICASAHGKDACQGDSGGPLVVGPILVGVVSFGLECADPVHPGIYTNVANYRKFIDRTTKRQAKWTKY